MKRYLNSLAVALAILLLNHAEILCTAPDGGAGPRRGRPPAGERERSSSAGGCWGPTPRRATSTSTARPAAAARETQRTADRRSDQLVDHRGKPMGGCYFVRRSWTARSSRRAPVHVPGQRARPAVPFDPLPPRRATRPTTPRSATSTATASTRSSLKQDRRPPDNAQRGHDRRAILEAYKLDGTLLWRIDLGRNIREGAHYTPVHGLRPRRRRPGRGRLQDRGRHRRRHRARSSAMPQADHRNADGLRPRRAGVPDRLRWAGPAPRWPRPTTCPPAGSVADWGDDYGNRVDRFLACVAYLDGQRPSLVMCRGYYTRAVLAAWNWSGGQLTRRLDLRQRRRHARATAPTAARATTTSASATWTATAGTRSSTAPAAIDDDGKGLYSTGLGHGDALHLSRHRSGPARAWRSSASTRRRASPAAPSSATRGTGR